MAANTGESKRLRELDTSKLGEYSHDELYHLATRIRKVVNENYDRMAKRGMYTPAMKALDEGTGSRTVKRYGKISTKGLRDKSRYGELELEVARGIRFLNMETSTVSGYNKYIQAIEDRGITGYSEWSEYSRIDFWKYYEEFQKRYNAHGAYSSDEVQRAAARVYNQYVRANELEELARKALIEYNEEKKSQYEVLAEARTRRGLAPPKEPEYQEFEDLTEEDKTLLVIRHRLLHEREV